MKNNKNRNYLIGGAVILIVVGLLGFNNFKALLSGNPARSTRELAMSCTLDMYTQFHIHPHLRIVVNGAEQSVPANVGITLDCMHPLHTHDATGEIHVESPEQRDFTLGDFFAVWGKTFGKDEILSYHADQDHRITMTVAGAENEEYENLILQDKQDIVIEYSSRANK